jgi:hypothetical protein
MMISIRIPKHALAAIGLGAMYALLASTPCLAQLGATGGTANASDGAVAHRAQNGLADYRETTDAHGIVVREYVDARGAVYAVSWRGPAMPNVQALLGAYFERFESGARATAGEAGLHAARVADGDLVVESQVRLREFSGRAWLASALPAGVSASDIQ